MKFTMTKRRIDALRYIQKNPGVYVGGVADNVLATRRLWPQAATRLGAGYCKALQTAGMVKIDTHVGFGYGRVTITPEGVRVLDLHEGADSSLDAVLARCCE